METLDYEKVFAGVKVELEVLQEKKVVLETDLADLTARVAAMTTVYNAIAPIVGCAPIPTEETPFIEGEIDVQTLRAAGITMAVRTVINTIPPRAQGMTATMVRDRLEQMGWDWRNYTNPLATVNTVLRRLKDSGAIELDPNTKSGARAFVPFRGITDDDVPF